VFSQMSYREDLMKEAKVQDTSPDGAKIWCEECSIRIAPKERRTIVRGKIYHVHCYEKLSKK
jgi:DNA-directed RNA polymerase subunit RPC12/RpoP